MDINGYIHGIFHGNTMVITAESHAKVDVLWMIGAEKLLAYLPLRIDTLEGL